MENKYSFRKFIVLPHLSKGLNVLRHLTLDVFVGERVEIDTRVG